MALREDIEKIFEEQEALYKKAGELLEQSGYAFLKIAKLVDASGDPALIEDTYNMLIKVHEEKKYTYNAALFAARAGKIDAVKRLVQKLISIDDDSTDFDGAIEVAEKASLNDLVQELQLKEKNCKYSAAFIINTVFANEPEFRIRHIYAHSWEDAAARAVKKAVKYERNLADLCAGILMRKPGQEGPWAKLEFYDSTFAVAFLEKNKISYE